jgi:hypothetical protein
MFAEQPYGRRLRALVSGFVGERHARANLQVGKRVVEHAVAAEVDFLSIVGLEKTKLAGWIKPRDRSGGCAFVMLRLTLRTAKLVLQLPAGAFERVVERKIWVGVALIRRRRPFHIHLAAVRQGEPDMDLVKPALAMPKTGPFQHNAARGYTAPALLEFGNMFFNDIFDLGGSSHPLKFDLRRRLHAMLHLNFSPTMVNDLTRGRTKPDSSSDDLVSSLMHINMGE